MMKKKGNIKSFEKVYQYKDGTFLLDAQQPRGYRSEYLPHTSTRYKNVVLRKNEVKELPELYERREDCCGCTACYSACTSSAISMEPDEEGFLYPVIDSSRCIRCYKCLRVCPMKIELFKKTYL